MQHHEVSVQSHHVRGEQKFNHSPLQRRHGVRNSRLFRSIEQTMSVLSGGERLEIVRTLADGPLNVTQLADLMFLHIKSVSRDLAVLDSYGLVTCCRNKNSRIYRLGDGVRVFRRDGCIQLAIITPTGNWLLVHLDERPDVAESPAPEAFTDLSPFRGRTADQAG